MRGHDMQRPTFVSREEQITLFSVYITKESPILIRTSISVGLPVACDQHYTYCNLTCHIEYYLTITDAVTYDLYA